MVRTNRIIKSEYHGSGFWFAPETPVELLRQEGDRVVIRGEALFFTCNNAKQPRTVQQTVSVPLDAITITHD